MGAPQTGLVDDVTELLILWPHLGVALERDAGAPEAEKVSGGGTFGLPVNADVLQALERLNRDVPALAFWAMRVVAETPAQRDIEGHLRHFPRFHERMLVTAAVHEAGQFAARVHDLVRHVKLAIGLLTHDRRLGHYCPLHDEPLCELVAPGDKGTLRYRCLDRAGQPVAPAVEWSRTDCALCRHCGASWAPSQYLLLGRLLRDADNRRVQAAADAIDEGAA
jgi:hypothetical protein